MSTNAANGHSNATEEQETTPAKAQAKQSGSHLVTAEGTDASSVILLSDNTRVVPTNTLPNNRPITANEFTVVGTLNSAGTRPIMADVLQVVNTELLPGHRPIVASNLEVSDLGFLPGNRPIAANDVVDPPPPVLMGYLD
ncbi:uncharacterized protein XM38_031590 [Halomicronema hongdechloris C2206]|uniref:Uncharacterized protein n=1 Tax=Halomicronema hongdechloris C2206 TaxID=1641165 RepID=A0A1Z3HPG4_9CYAN|nr:hypothetical protein [Halomicronema hongdechloris]ASC72204.1 uncharacterized protein XM38_031590 [Halomicronema hongdechloris C2206]